MPRIDREGRPKPTITVPVQKFRIILDGLSGGEVTTIVPREILLEALDSYTSKDYRWLVVPA
jgi:hypothetical protein